MKPEDGYQPHDLAELRASSDDDDDWDDDWFDDYPDEDDDEPGDD